MADSVSVVLTGSGGAGVMTAGQILLEAAAKAGYYGLMTRSSGPQIRGGEAAALLRLARYPVQTHDDSYDLLVAFDWNNVGRFAPELPLGPQSLILRDPAQGDMPEEIAAYGAREAEIPLGKLAKEIKGGRANMVGLGAVAALIGLPLEPLLEVVEKALARKGAEAQEASAAGIRAGVEAVADIAGPVTIDPPEPGTAERWNISGNEGTGLGAVRGGVRFVAAYPITPATEVLEWLAPNLADLGGILVQAEDEIASINMCLGASFGGVPALTATAGPGLSLMIETIGLGVASETPVVVVDVMRGGPSTGIPTKSEQSDLNIAVYGLHGDAPHLVLAPNSIADCVFTTQWTVHLAEALQCPAILLSDQAMGQARAVIDRPADISFMARRVVAEACGEDERYDRYAVTASGVSPMAIPGTPGCMYTADGLEHTARGAPSSLAADHQEQLDKRKRKLTGHDFGSHWADVEGEGSVAVLTWGSTTAPVREALSRLRAEGRPVRLVSVRLLSPPQPGKMAAALEGVEKLLVVEQSHEAQFYHFLRAHYDLPPTVAVLNRPGPLPIRPQEIVEHLQDWMS